VRKWRFVLRSIRCFATCVSLSLPIDLMFFSSNLHGKKPSESASGRRSRNAPLPCMLRSKSEYVILSLLSHATVYSTELLLTRLCGCRSRRLRSRSVASRRNRSVWSCSSARSVSSLAVSIFSLAN
jgi:hypothetical protein